MRVLHLAPPSRCPDHLTAHSFIDEEIVALRDAGVECLTLPPDESAHWRDRGAAIALAICRAASWRVPLALALGEAMHAIRLEVTAARLVRERQVEVIHSHFGWPAGFGGAIAAAIADVPLVASLRGMDLLSAPEIGYGLRRSRAYDAALGQLLQTAARTLYATEYMRREGIAAGAPADRATVVRKGVDSSRFRPGASHREVPVVLAVGTLSPRKNLRLVLDALARIGDLPWTFVIVGDGAERAALEARAIDLGIGARVRFAGTISRAAIGGYFASADVFVHAAVVEAAGNVILEALAAACPIVCTDAGGPTEYVRDGETGFVVPMGDAQAMSRRLRQLLASAALRCSMAHSARVSATREFAYNRMIGDLIRIYGEVAAARISSRSRYVRLIPES